MKNKAYYVSIIILFITLKFYYKILNIDDLNILLKPTNELVKLITSQKSIYISQKGYYFKNINTIIDKSCSGFNFLLICFSLFSFSFIHLFRKNFYKIILIITCFISSLLATIIVNTSRIVASITIQNTISNLFHIKESMIHQFIGISSNLIFLALSYTLIQSINNNKKTNEKIN